MTATKSETLQIEEGKFYRNGKGQKISVKPYTLDSEKVYLWQGNEGLRFYYTREGRLHPDDVTDDDLISEWPDTPADPAPEAESEQIEQLKEQLDAAKRDCVFLDMELHRTGHRYAIDQEQQKRIQSYYQPEAESAQPAATATGEGSITPPTKYDVYRPAFAALQSVDIVRHEAEQLRKANAELEKENQSLFNHGIVSQTTFDQVNAELTAERDRLKGELRLAQAAATEEARHADELQAQLAAATKPVNQDDVEWVVNDYAELGVKIGSRFFWLYKGNSLVYRDGCHDDGSPMMWRHVGKREFGECCHPRHLDRLPEQYTEGEGWQPIPQQPPAAPVEEWRGKYEFVQVPIFVSAGEAKR